MKPFRPFVRVNWKSEEEQPSKKPLREGSGQTLELLGSLEPSYIATILLGGLPMNGTTALHDIYDLLRSVEHYCYQVAYYVLGNEGDAAAASEGALLALARDSAFTTAAAEDRRALAKKAAVACAMKRARERCASSTPKELHPQVAND